MSEKQQQFFFGQSTIHHALPPRSEYEDTHGKINHHNDQTTLHRLFNFRDHHGFCR